MSIITWPSELIPGAVTGWGQRRYDMTYESDVTGSRQDILLGPPRWTLAIQQPEVLSLETAGKWQALAMQLRGRVNHLLVWDFGRPLPLGTFGPGAAEVKLGAQANAGTNTLQVISDASQNGKSLLPGDKIQIGTGLGTSQLVMVVALSTANASGTITLTVEPAVRVTFPVNTPVVYDKASAYFKLTQASSSWRYGAGGLFSSGITFDLIEVWS